MQEFRSIGRMRAHPQQALKCPRCDSLNTKFCYYNNYNLSQPRHFCKSCRRYWTKGGVLRNVPVGGGCRKTKRSSKPKPDDRKNNRNSTSHSSSESSSVTTTTAVPPHPPPPPPTTTTTTPAAEVINPPFNLENFHQPSDPSIFPDTGSFTSLMTASNPAILGFNFDDLTGNSSSLPFQFQHQQQKMVGMVEEMKMQELTAGYMDQTVPIELPQLENRGSNGGLTAFDWQSNGDQGLFDLTGGTGHGYWNHPQWGESDPNNLYLP